MELFVTLLIIVAGVAFLGAMANTFGTDSRDLVIDDHARPSWS
jgi:hypothetical protein